MAGNREIRQAGEQHLRNTLQAMAAAQQLWSAEHPAAPPEPAGFRAGAAPEAAVAPHLVKNLLSQAVFYPAHDKRKESKGYRAARKELVDRQDRPCLVCGVRKSTLGDPTENRFGARQLETHHRIVEWALANAVDLAKFNARIVAGLRRSKPNDPTYERDFTKTQMLDWIDHGRDNLWVLCDVHHRHKYVGIHAISYPIWGPQDILQDGFGAVIPE